MKIEGKPKRPKPIRSIFLKSILLLFLPIIGFVVFSYLTYPLKPHCSLGQRILGCTPKCEPVSFYENGRPSAYKTVPCYHDEPTELQSALFKNWIVAPLLGFIFFSFWIYKEGSRKVINTLLYVAAAPLYIFKENRKNKNILSRLAVIFVLFFLFIEWGLGYYVVAATLTKQDPFRRLQPKQNQTQLTSPAQSICARTTFFETSPEFQRALNLIKQRVEQQVIKTGKKIPQSNTPYLLNTLPCIDVKYDQAIKKYNAEGYFVFGNKEATKNYLPIYVDYRFQESDDILTAILLVHEIQHAVQFLNYLDGKDNLSCLDKEVQAFVQQADFIFSLNKEEKNSLIARIVEYEKSASHYNSGFLSMIKTVKQLMLYGAEVVRECGGNPDDVVCIEPKYKEKIKNFVYSSPIYLEQCSEDY